MLRLALALLVAAAAAQTSGHAGHATHAPASGHHEAATPPTASPWPKEESSPWPKEEWRSTYLMAGITWAGVCLAIAALFFNVVKTHRKNPEPFGIDILIPYGVAMFMEGFGFLFYTLNHVFLRSMFVDTFVFGVWQLINSGTHWVTLMFFLYQDGDNGMRRFSISKAWKLWMSVAAGMVLTYVFLAHRGSGLKNMVFLLAFEPPMFIRLGCSLAIAASLPGKRGWFALGFTAAKALMIVAHVYTLFVALNPGSATKNTFPITRYTSAALELCASFCLLRMTQLGIFTPSKKAEREQHRSVIVPSSGTKQGMWETHYFFPERVFTYCVVPIFFGYLGAGTLLFNVTKPDFLQDPVYEMYHTFHPCMLLDYLPGSLWAMPMFTLVVLFQIAGSLGMFTRAVLFGDLFLTVVSAMGTSFFIAVGFLFVLVFPFAPAKTSVIFHSIPYMLQTTGIAVVFFVNAFVTFKISSKQKEISFRSKQFYFLFVFFFLNVVLYGLSFMTTTMLDYSGYGSSLNPPLAFDDPATRTKELKKMTINGQELELDFAPMLAAIAMPMLLLIHRFLCPLKSFPIAFEMCLYEASSPPLPAPKPTASAIGNDNSQCAYQRMRFSIRSFFSLGVALLLGTVFCARFLNTAVHGSAAVSDWSFREFVEAAPGSYVFAVGWIPAAICVLIYAVLKTMHVCRSKTAIPTFVPVVLLAAMVIGLVVVPTNTIPGIDAEGYGWWAATIPGFKLVMALWLAMEMLTATPSGGSAHKNGGIIDQTDGCFQLCKATTCWPTFMYVGELGSAGMAVFCLLVSASRAHMHNAHLKNELAWLAALALWSIFDSQGIGCACENIRFTFQEDRLAIYKFLDPVQGTTTPDASSSELLASSTKSGQASTAADEGSML